MKKIIVPIDFSEVSENALIAATEIARKTQAEVEIFHVIESSGGTTISETGEIFMPDKMEQVYVLKCIELAKNKIHSILENVRYAGVRFIPKIKVGDPGKHFSRYITLEKADMIIMGTSGSEGILKGIFNESNAEKVVTRADCMVLSVKNNNKDFHMRNLVLATNFQDDSPEFIGKLKALQEIFDFKIHLLYINPLINYESNQSIIQSRLRDYVNRFQLKNCESIIQEDLTEYNGIVKYAEDINADIIALSTHQHKGLHWLGGISEDLVNFAEFPVLTFKVN
ncbi:universal stress protein [Sporocytophaga myxococcoides]|uniref:universal stress protein n=1 Tax=Sporocytophaga myxococcoides TaxID=153721 RepID=UPI00042521E7|nr:universal stress protein [Sporocytophaga myxococcoides]